MSEIPWTDIEKTALSLGLEAAYQRWRMGKIEEKLDQQNLLY